MFFGATGITKISKMQRYASKARHAGYSIPYAEANLRSDFIGDVQGRLKTQRDAMDFEIVRRDPSTRPSL